jgi:hypothetical protein
MLRKLSTRTLWRLALVGSLLVVGACGAARPITRTQTGGVLELQGDRGKAMEDANQQMAAHCGPNNFIIEREGEEVVGQDTVVQQSTAEDSKTSKSGRRTSTDSATTTTQSTRNATAWRVYYACGAGGAVGGGEPPPPPAPPQGMPPPPPAAPSGW